MIRKTVAGGQTDADRGALEAAKYCGIPHGGWCPHGRRAEDGRIPLMGKSYAEIVADEIKAAGFSIGVIEYLDRSGRRMWAADALKSDGHRWIARADSELKAWIALKAMLWEAGKFDGQTPLG